MKSRKREWYLYFNDRICISFPAKKKLRICFGAFICLVALNPLILVEKFQILTQEDRGGDPRDVIWRTDGKHGDVVGMRHGGSNSLHNLLKNAEKNRGRSRTEKIGIAYSRSHQEVSRQSVEEERTRRDLLRTNKGTEQQPSSNNNGDSTQKVDGSTNDESECLPLHWHSASFPTCNIMHEIDMLRGIVDQDYPNRTSAAENDLHYLGKGSVRDVWKITENLESRALVLKTLLIDDQDFSKENYKKHHHDAISMERLTSSPNVVDIYGYCGQSALNELAEPLQRNVANHPVASTREALRFARDAAAALADVHGIDKDLAPSLVHTDVGSKNFVVSLDGKAVKINDFNLATFLKWNPKTKSTCGFRKRGHNEYRSPEEVKGELLNEKIDVYSLAGVFYFILTGKHPYTYPYKLHRREYTKLIANGTTPIIPPHIEYSNDPAISTIRRVMKLCYSYSAQERPSAREVFEILDVALDHITQNETIEPRDALFERITKNEMT